MEFAAGSVGARRWRQVCVAVLFAALFNVGDCSWGDVQPGYQKCLGQCRRTGCTRGVGTARTGATCSGLCPGRSEAIPLAESLLRWDCKADCQYLCMHEEEAIGKPHRGTVKYYGKWPFQRFLGMQEPLSVLFSLLNLAAHASGFRSLRRSLRRSRASAGPRPFPALWAAFFALSANSWLWSAVFHARDTKLTERGDYFSAGALLAFSAFMPVSRFLGPTAARLAGAALAAGMLLHYRYMALVLFDYGWNMKVCVGLGVTQSALWVGFTQLRRHPARGRILLLVAAVHAASLLELLDFPPIAGWLDAHALWHAATLLPTRWWYDFAATDCEVAASGGGGGSAAADKASRED